MKVLENLVLVSFFPDFSPENEDSFMTHMRTCVFPEIWSDETVHQMLFRNFKGLDEIRSHSK